MHEHKQNQCKRKVKLFSEKNWYMWGRNYFDSDLPRIYVNGKLISEVNNDSVHISFTGNVKELNCNTCDIDGDAFTVHGNSVKVKGNVGGSIEANSIEVGGNVQGDIDANSVKVKGRHTGSINV